MYKPLLILFAFISQVQPISAQETVSSVLEKSRLYYSSHPHTKNLIYYEYKPAIAEVNLLDTFRVTHCDSFLKIESAFYEKIVTNGKYIAIDHTKRAYMDFSPYKEVYNDVIRQMDIYPFVNIHFLDRILKRIKTQE